MWILPLLGYLGVIVGFSFLTLAIGKICVLPHNGWQLGAAKLGYFASGREAK